MGILEQLEKGPVLGDGGYLLELEKRGYVKAGPFTPEVVVKFPHALEELHREHVRAGADVIQALCFYATRKKLSGQDGRRLTREINANAVRIARRAANENKRKKVLVAGNLALTWQYRPGSARAERETREAFREQIMVQKAEGVDFFIAETLEYLGEALIALEEIKKTGLPSMVTMSIKNTEKTKEGVNVANACRILEENGADIVGLNCARDPDRTLPVMEKIMKKVECFTACQPNAFRCTGRLKYFQSQRYRGRMAFPVELDPLQLSRMDMAEYALKAKKMGINYIGSCCGSVACHTREMAKVLGKHGEAFRYLPDLKVHPIIGHKRHRKETDENVLKQSKIF